MELEGQTDSPAENRSKFNDVHDDGVDVADKGEKHGCESMM